MKKVLTVGDFDCSEGVGIQSEMSLQDKVKSNRDNYGGRPYG